MKNEFLTCAKVRVEALAYKGANNIYSQKEALELVELCRFENLKFS